jgi:hypothetical protein
VQLLSLRRLRRLDALDTVEDAVPVDRTLPVAFLLELIGALRSLESSRHRRTASPSAARRPTSRSGIIALCAMSLSHRGCAAAGRKL